MNKLEELGRIDFFFGMRTGTRIKQRIRHKLEELQYSVVELPHRFTQNVKRNLIIDF